MPLQINKRHWVNTDFILEVVQFEDGTGILRLVEAGGKTIQLTAAEVAHVIKQWEAYYSGTIVAH